MKYLLPFCLFLCSIHGHSQSYDWGGTLGGTQYDKSYQIITDPNDGSMYICGMFFGQFSPTFDHTFSMDAIDAIDAFVVKISASGSMIWANQLGGLDNEFAIDLALDSQNDLVVLVNETPNVSVYKFAGGDGNFIWYYSSDYTLQTNANNLTLDADDNIYVCGVFSDSVDFDNSANTDYLIPEGNEDGFFLKLDENGEYLWAKSIGDASGGALPNAIIYDGGSHLYVTGMFYGTMDFDPSTGNYPMYSWGSTDGFNMKLDTAGNFVWANQTGAVENVDPRSIALDDLGNVYISGMYSGTADFDPTSANFPITAIGLWDSYVLKLDADGNFIWAVSFGGSEYDITESLIIDENNQLFLTGYFTGAVDFDPSADVYELDAGLQADAFNLKLNDSGELIWVNKLSSNAGLLNGTAITVDYQGNIICTGTFSDFMDLDPTDDEDFASAIDYMDVYVVKLNPSTAGLIDYTAEDVTLFPNPAHEEFRLSGIDQVDVRIYNQNGQIIHSEHVQGSNPILTEKMPAGTYFVQIDNGIQSITKKLIVK